MFRAVHGLRAGIALLSLLAPGAALAAELVSIPGWPLAPVGLEWGTTLGGPPARAATPSTSLVLSGFLSEAIRPGSPNARLQGAILSGVWSLGRRLSLDVDVPLVGRALDDDDGGMPFLRIGNRRQRTLSDQQIGGFGLGRLVVGNATTLSLPRRVLEGRGAGIFIAGGRVLDWRLRPRLSLFTRQQLAFRVEPQELAVLYLSTYAAGVRIWRGLSAAAEVNILIGLTEQGEEREAAAASGAIRWAGRLARASVVAGAGLGPDGRIVFGSYSLMISLELGGSAPAPGRQTAR